MVTATPTTLQPPWIPWPTDFNNVALYPGAAGATKETEAEGGLYDAVATVLTAGATYVYPVGVAEVAGKAVLEETEGVVGAAIDFETGM